MFARAAIDRARHCGIAAFAPRQAAAAHIRAQRAALIGACRS
jgi:hypothetical protein